ncbi:MAG: DUF6377 domain-containing protein [Prevotellaceae bacterium]|jgi:hypothetical protein|nr:DUF6377 domain-containing protein [Prevotellaceae bacterium]
MRTIITIITIPINRISLCLIFTLCFSCSPAPHGGGELATLLSTLDRALDSAGEYDRQKERRLADLKRQLLPSSPPDQRANVYRTLYREYEAYIFDSAMHYVQLQLELATEMRHTHQLNECKMQLARMYATFARFTDAVALMSSIRRQELTQEQRLTYYNTYGEIYLYWMEYADNADAKTYAVVQNAYRDSALAISPTGYSYDVNYGNKCIEAKDVATAELVLLPHLTEVDPETREYAILTSLVASLYAAKGDEQLQKAYLIRSAIADVKASVKENTSLRNLAFHLLNDDEIDRSNRYIKKSLEDANFYNARLRNVQIAKILPVIDKAYQLEREKRQKSLLLTVITIGMLTLMGVGVICYLFKQMQNLSRTRKKLMAANTNLRKANFRLSESNHIKEEYIGRFLNQCSTYIDKLSAYRKSLNKTASNGKLEELFRALKSTQIIEDELEEFYRNFDSAFLKLFPNFVEEFNKLLPKSEQIHPKYTSELTVELRIFALLRLGITDSAKIAGFLRYSIHTIYNYRSKYRSNSLVPRDKFEEAVMKIGHVNL